MSLKQSWWLKRRILWEGSEYKTDNKIPIIKTAKKHRLNLKGYKNE
jgi:hypothetical protein